MLGIVFAIAASTFLNVGKGMQKWKVAVLAHKSRVLRAEHRGHFALWLLGLGMTASATVLYSLALKYTDKPSTVSALNGAGLIGLVLFAGVVLKEKVGLRECAGAALVILGTALMGWFEVPVSQAEFSAVGFWSAAGGLLGVCATLALVSWRTRRGHGLIFGSLAGSLIGSGMVLADIALVEASGDIVGQFGGPYVYLALLLGNTALVVTQFAFWRAPAMVVVPTTNAAVIVAPLMLQWFTFDTVLLTVQYVAIAVIVIGVVVMTTRPAATLPAVQGAQEAT